MSHAVSCGCAVAATFGPVAMHMFWAAMAAVFIMSEIECLSGKDRLTTLGGGAGRGLSSGYPCRPHLAEVAMSLVVAALCRAASTLLVLAGVDVAVSLLVGDEGRASAGRAATHGHNLLTGWGM